MIETRKIMAICILFLSFLYMYLITFVEIPECGKEHAKTILGFLLGTGFANLLHYYWGSSSKEERKTDGSQQS